MQKRVRTLHPCDRQFRKARDGTSGPGAGNIECHDVRAEQKGAAKGELVTRIEREGLRSPACAAAGGALTGSGATSSPLADSWEGKIMRLKEKLALITAAGQGIGRATAERFSAEGARVVATDIDADALKGLDDCRTLPLDVTDQAAVVELAGSLGPVDILFNCAGFVHSGTILDCEREDWDYSFNLNVLSMYFMIRAFLPAMLESGGGSIINVSSVASSITGAPNRFVYGATKAAVIGLTKSVAADFVTQGVRCNAICPGTVQTPSLEERLAATGDYRSARKSFVARQPMQRFGTADEVAAMAAYLASDEAGFVTGQCHVIDGGWTI